jgi:hypothetical protein
MEKADAISSVALFASVTVIFIPEKVPVAVAVPPITPVEESNESPAGREPADTAYVLFSRPLLAVTEMRLLPDRAVPAVIVTLERELNVKAADIVSVAIDDVRVVGVDPLRVLVTITV